MSSLCLRRTCRAAFKRRPAQVTPSIERRVTNSPAACGPLFSETGAPGLALRLSTDLGLEERLSWDMWSSWCFDAALRPPGFMGTGPASSCLWDGRFDWFGLCRGDWRMLSESGMIRGIGGGGGGRGGGWLGDYSMTMIVTILWRWLWHWWRQWWWLLWFSPISKARVPSYKIRDFDKVHHHRRRHHHHRHHRHHHIIIIVII